MDSEARSVLEEFLKANSNATLAKFFEAKPEMRGRLSSWTFSSWRKKARGIIKPPKRQPPNEIVPGMTYIRTSLLEDYRKLIPYLQANPGVSYFTASRDLGLKMSSTTFMRVLKRLQQNPPPVTAPARVAPMAHTYAVVATMPFEGLSDSVKENIRHLIESIRTLGGKRFEAVEALRPLGMEIRVRV